ncbi:hypothetical protein Q8F55_002724 [Vanrija albida]|uniref:BTB domain-containing protein n=1 Tax=Vanrija albida TaxID=181172 RepID=A0ABR3QB60_9TREE
MMSLPPSYTVMSQRPPSTILTKLSASMQRQPSAGETIHDDKDFRNGDFTLISSNNIRFRVDSVYLFAASPIFRDAEALSRPDDKLVHFTDESENDATITTFLTLVTQAKLVLFYKEHLRICQHLSDCVAFLKKHECIATLRTLIYAFIVDFLLRDDLDYSLPGLLLGALVDDIDICVRAINVYRGKVEAGGIHKARRRSGTRDWGRADAEDNAPSAPRKSEFGDDDLLPANMPLLIHQLFPMSYVWILSRSWAEAGGDFTLWGRSFEKLAKRLVV